MLLSKKIRLEVKEQDIATLEFMQSKCRGLYNWWIGRLREGEDLNVYSAKKTLQESKRYDPELAFVYGKLLQEVYFRLDKAMKAFFRRVKAGEKAGFPRFKPRHEFFTLCYPALYIAIDGNAITLPTGGGTHSAVPKHYPNVIALLTEIPPANFREVAVTRDGRGNYYASFVYHESEQEKRDGGVVAFDLGMKTLATGVNEQGRFYEIGGFKGSSWYDRQLDKIRSKRDHCKKKSRRYIHLSKVYKKVSEQRCNKQRDSLHKASHLIAHKLAERAVVVGDLSQKQMVTNPKRKRNKQLNRRVFNNWGLFQFVQMLEYKCLLYGKDFSKIDERDTSKMCSGCQAKQSMPLWKRTYRCENCGLVMDRDKNSAVNIIQRFLAWQRPHTGDPVRCAGVITATDHVKSM